MMTTSFERNAAADPTGVPFQRMATDTDPTSRRVGASARWAAFSLAAIVVTSAACSSDDEPAAAVVAGPTTVGSGYDTAVARSGIRIGVNDACGRLAEAEQRRALAAGCVINVIACPDFLRQLMPAEARAREACADWDKGTIEACESHIASFTCDSAFSSPCQLTYFPGTGTGRNPETCATSTGVGGTSGGSY